MKKKTLVTLSNMTQTLKKLFKFTNAIKSLKKNLAILTNMKHSVDVKNASTADAEGDGKYVLKLSLEEIFHLDIQKPLKSN